MTEYEFTLPDGTKRYEICDGANDVHAFMRMHKATAAMPVKPSEPEREPVKLGALMAQHGVTIAAVFIPFSQSRNAKEKHLSLNWRVTLQRDGRAILSSDYGAGVAHCPAYKLSVKEAGGINSIMRHDMLKHECETGRTYHRFGALGSAILPDSVNVFACLLRDADALQYASFADWCSELGFDSDSIKARGIYEECLAHGLAMRAAFGADLFDALYSAACDE